MSRGRRVGLYRFRSAKPRAPNSETELRELLARIDGACRRVRRDRPRTPHAKLAWRALKRVPLMRKRIATLDTQDDKHFTVMEAMRLALDVCKLEHSLELLEVWEWWQHLQAGRRGKRKATPAKVRDARRLTKGMKRGRQKEIARIIGVGPRRWQQIKKEMRQQTRSDKEFA